MRWFIYTLLLLVAFTAAHVVADHNQPPILPGALQPTPALQKLYDRGELRYAFDVNAAAYPGFKQQTAEVAAVFKERLHITFREVNPAFEPVDVWMKMPSDGIFTSTCGAGAAACVFYSADPVQTYFRQALGYVNWKTAIAHEWGHILGLHEMYNDKEFKCLFGIPVKTMMDCGSSIDYPTYEHDVPRIFNVVVPDAACNIGYARFADGWIRMDWIGAKRCDGGLAHYGSTALENATRVSFAWAASPFEAPTWAGFWCGPEFNYCFSSFKSGFTWFDPSWQGCMYFRFENAAVYDIGQISAPDYWRLAGCS